MTNFGEAIKRPFTDFKKLLIGALFFMIPFVNLITGLFATGYALNGAKTAMKKKYAMPEWADWGKMFVNGLLGGVIYIIYMLPALIIFIIGLISSITLGIGVSIGTLVNALVSNDSAAIANAISGMIGVSGLFLVTFFLAVLLVLIAAYVTPMAIMAFIATDKFGEAFNLKAVFGKAFRGNYFVAFLISLLYVIALAVIAGILDLILAITIIGPAVVNGFYTFIVTVTLYTIFGEVYAEK